MKKIKIIALFLAILGVAGYFLFDYLGGNRPVELSLVAKSPDTLTGKTFRGTPLDKGLEAVFQTIQGTQKLHPGTSLHTIYYVEPAGKLDTLEVFAGINLPFGTCPCSGPLRRFYLQLFLPQPISLFPFPNSVSDFPSTRIFAP